jgi:hypothetical protein
MNAVAWLLNTAWMAQASIELARFARASRNVAATQLALLRRTLWANRDSEFGRRHGFANIAGVRAFQDRVPLATYDDFAPDIDRIAAGARNVLTCEPVRLLEPTSGTTGGEKLIPYTAGLRRQFQRGVATWIAELFRRRPRVRAGRAYWSISPMLGPVRRSAGGLPIGFDDDTAYLGALARFAVRKLLIAPAALARSSDMISFRYATLLALLAADDLALISAWSPTFLTALLAPLEAWQDRLCHDLHDGSFHLPKPERARRVGRILRSTAPWPDKLRRIWPNLALISCWADAAAAQFLPELQALFPTVEVQPKGLLATEGFVSLPLIDRPGAALAVRCHFFEFEEVGHPGRCRLAHELDEGGRYRVVLTTAGGLYRYQLRDEVDVVGRHHECPLLRFIGKADTTSDLVGEKLAEAHVRSVLDRVMRALSLQARFAMVVPVRDRPPRYRLYLQAAGVALPSIRERLDEGLMENPYYRHAVTAGQLAPVEVVALDPDGDSAWLLYERRCLADGQKCGNIKPTALDRRMDWPAVFGTGMDRVDGARALVSRL